jgi:RNA polymerase sigma-70 factor (ECF subfamily)
MYGLLREKTEEEPISLRDFYESYGDFLYGVAYKMLHSKEAAEDAVQTLFLRLLSKKETPTDTSHFISLAVVILKNCCIDKLRKSRRKLFSLDDDYTRDLPALDQPIDIQAEQKNVYALMKEAVRALPEEARQVFTMKYVLSMSYDEIAEQCHLSNSKISGILRRARSKIKKTMERDLEGEIL